MRFTAKDIHEIVQENKDEILECLSEVLRTPSVSGEELEVSKVFQKWIEKTGLETKVVGPAPTGPTFLPSGAVPSRGNGSFSAAIWILLRRWMASPTLTGLIRGKSRTATVTGEALPT